MSTLSADTGGVIVACRQCGQAARLRYESLDRDTRCGRCQSPLQKLSAPVAIGDVTAFDAMLAHSAVPIIVDFWATWCGPCRVMAPEFEKVASAKAGTWLAVKVDTDHVTELGERYGIRSIPTLMVFRDGQVVRRQSGAMMAADIQRFMESST